MGIGLSPCKICGCNCLTYIQVRDDCGNAYRIAVDVVVIDAEGNEYEGITGPNGVADVRVPGTGLYKVRTYKTGCTDATFNDVEVECGETAEVNISCGNGKITIINSRCCAPLGNNASLVPATLTGPGGKSVSVPGGTSVVPTWGGGQYQLSKPAGDGCKAATSQVYNLASCSNVSIGLAAQVRDDLVCCGTTLIPRTLFLMDALGGCTLTYGGANTWTGVSRQAKANTDDIYDTEYLGRFRYTYEERCDPCFGQCKDVFGRALKNRRQIRSGLCYTRYTAVCGLQFINGQNVFGLGVSGEYAYKQGFISDYSEYAFNWWCRDRWNPITQSWFHEKFPAESEDCNGPEIETIGISYYPDRGQCFKNYPPYNYHCGVSWCSEGAVGAKTTSVSGWAPGDGSRGTGFTLTVPLSQNNSSLVILPSLTSDTTQTQELCDRYAPPAPGGYSVTISG